MNLNFKVQVTDYRLLSVEDHRTHHTPRSLDWGMSEIGALPRQLRVPAFQVVGNDRQRQVQRQRQREEGKPKDKGGERKYDRDRGRPDKV